MPVRIRLHILPFFSIWPHVTPPVDSCFLGMCVLLNSQVLEERRRTSSSFQPLCFPFQPGSRQAHDCYSWNILHSGMSQQLHWAIYFTPSMEGSFSILVRSFHSGQHKCHSLLFILFLMNDKGSVRALPIQKFTSPFGQEVQIFSFPHQS